jgi:hypothetical protein
MALAPNNNSKPPQTSPVPEPQGQSIAQLQLSAQETLEAETGIKIRGVLGGLPVAEQRQEYFVVFNEAGDTGPELIDKTQYRVTYLVDSKLNTSKPAENSDSAINVTQNFEEGKIASVRADNATSLNKNLTGDLSIYDVGTIRLIATTETGSSPGGFLQTMSFGQPNGQSIVSDAFDLSIEYNSVEYDTQPVYGTSTIIGPDGLLLSYPSASKAISASAAPFYDDIDSTPFNTLEILRNTTEGGTRINVLFNVFLQADWSVISNIAAAQPVEGLIQLEFQDSGTGDFIVIDTQTYSIPVGNTSYFYPAVSTVNFGHFQAGSKFRCRLFRTDTFLGGAQLIVRGGKCKVTQEYLPGLVSVPGLNAATANYFDPDFTTFQPISESENQSGYSILTSSVELGYFINNGFQSILDDQCKAFDPNGDTVTFETIQVPYTFQIGDEIRFEYNKNKVHKVVGIDKLNTGAYHITVSPLVTSGSIINHFTHYRIEEDGGYIILNTKKDNQVASNQPFSGIILPKFPSENLEAKTDGLIFELKQAGIIEI